MQAQHDLKFSALFFSRTVYVVFVYVEDVVLEGEKFVICLINLKNQQRTTLHFFL